MTALEATTPQEAPSPGPCLRPHPGNLADCNATSASAAAAHDPDKVALALSSAPLVPALQKWNHPSVNRNRYFATVLGLTIMGLNDACLGALLPYIERYYDIGYTVVSLLFLTSFVGYMAAALSSNLIHHHFGQRGVAIIAPLSRLIGYIVMVLHPPFFAILPIAMLFPGFGNGLEDSAWNAFVGGLQHANQLLGILHGAYGAGATIAPLIATTMVTRGSPALEWYTYYYIMIGLSALELCFTTTAFWGANAVSYRHRYASEQADGARITTRTVLNEPITWMLALFLLGYVGAEVSLGGWITSFSKQSFDSVSATFGLGLQACLLMGLAHLRSPVMFTHGQALTSLTQVLVTRKAQPFLAGLTVTFFWLGLTIGRITLGFLTGRIGEKLAITIYLLLSIALQLLYWLVPSFVASTVCATFLGFFLGPLFPAAIVAATKLLPPEYHVSAIGFAAAFGGGGAAVFPFAVGAIAQAKGVEVLQPIMIAILAFVLLIWLSLPGGLKKGGLETAREQHEPVGQDFRRLYNRLKSNTTSQEG